MDTAHKRTGRLADNPKLILTLDRVRIGKNCLLIIFLLLMNKFGTLGNVLSYIILLAIALRNVEGALKALSISGLMIVASSFLVAHSVLFAPLKFVLLIAAVLTILKAARNPLSRPFLTLLLLFGLVVAVLAVVNDYFVEISLLKIFAFTFGAFGLLAVACIRRDIVLEITEWIVSLILVAALISYLALITGNGFGIFETLSGRVFSSPIGMFSHPQILGLMGCLFSLYLTGLLLFTGVSDRKFLTLLLFSWLILLYLSESRTALYGYVLALGTTILLLRSVSIPHSEQRLIRQRVRKIVINPALLGLLAIVIAEITTGLVSSNALQFIYKEDKEIEFGDVSLDKLFESREELIERSWSIFLENPVTGIGFGTALNPRWQQHATILSASKGYEKGFLPAALLEEVGVLGAIPFVLFILSLYSFCIRSRRYLSTLMLTGFLFVNLGEMTFFAFGGAAMLSWSVIGMSMAGGVIQGRVYQRTTSPSKKYLQ